MTVSELMEELSYYDPDTDVVFELDDDIEVESWTEDKYGNKSVHVDKNLKVTFSCMIHDDYLNIELGVDDE